MLLYAIDVTKDVIFQFGEVPGNHWVVRTTIGQIVRQTPAVSYETLLQNAHLFGLNRYDLSAAQDQARARSFELISQNVARHG